jgi:hypothetical protein
MASATFPRDTELRDTPTALPLAAAGVFLVLAVALTYQADLSLWLSHHHAHVIEKALLALDRGRIELIGFVYPPLPFLLLLPRPSPAFAGLLAAGCGALVVWTLSRALGRLSLPRWAAAIVLLGLATPSMFFLFTQSLWEALLLVLLLLAWWQSIEFIWRGNVRAGAVAGLPLGLAFLANYYALLFALPYALTALLFVRTSRRGAGPAAAFMLLFPAVAALLSWMYLSWVFTGQPLSFTRDPGSSMFAFLRPDGADLPTGWSAALSATGRDLVMAPLYMVMAVVVAWYRPLRLPVFLVFALFVLGLRTFGFVLPDYFATTTFTVVALAALPSRLPRYVWPLVLLTALLQFGLGWMIPLRGEAAAWQRAITSGVARPADREEFAVGQSLAGRPVHSILIDDRIGYRIIARAGTARPFLTPVDPLYRLAVSQPARFVPSMLAQMSESDDAGRALATAHPGVRLTRLSTTWWLYEWPPAETALRVRIR